MKIIARIMSLSDKEVKKELSRVFNRFAERHFNIETVFLQHYEQAKTHYFLDQELSRERKLLIGAYFTNEYSIESAALFNPSMVPHPDQSQLAPGSLRFVMSLRGVGESHISSITFREGVIDRENNIRMEIPYRVIAPPIPNINQSYDKELFEQKLYEIGVGNAYSEEILSSLPDKFTLNELKGSIKYLGDKEPKLSKANNFTKDNMLWLALSNYEVEFPTEYPLSSRIIFPYSPTEKKGLEDARFVEFRKDDGTITYYATYTAWSGRVMLPQLLETPDFLHFKMNTLNGRAVQNKGMALFPQKLGGQYVMLSRQDGENIYLMYSHNIHFWQETIPLLKPAYPWEFVQLGNCGSPLLIDEGWLVLIHGVGPMRTYCVSVVLLDKNDPSRVIGRFKNPLLKPKESEREGYVPNVVYSCGSLIHNRNLIIPYAISDSASRIAIVSLIDILSHLE